MKSIKCRIKIPNAIKKEYIEMAYSIISKNMENEEHIITTSKEVFYNDNKHISLAVEDVLIGYVPKSWLIPVE